MNRPKCQEVISAFKERASHYQSVQKLRELTVEELQSMKREYLNFTRGLLQALSEKEKQDIDLDGVKRIFRGSGLKKEELSDDELDDLIKSASEDDGYEGKVVETTARVVDQPYSGAEETPTPDNPDYLEQIYTRLDSIDRRLADYIKRQDERHDEVVGRLDQLSAKYEGLKGLAGVVEDTEYDVTCRHITIQPSIEIIAKVSSKSPEE